MVPGYGCSAMLGAGWGKDGLLGLTLHAAITLWVHETFELNRRHATSPDRRGWKWRVRGREQIFEFVAVLVPHTQLLVGSLHKPEGPERFDMLIGCRVEAGFRGALTIPAWQWRGSLPTRWRSPRR